MMRLLTRCRHYSIASPPSYRALSGTSMACPHIAGIAALYLEDQALAMTPDQVVSTMQCNAIPDILDVVEGGGWYDEEPRFLAQVPPQDFPVNVSSTKKACNSSTVGYICADCAAF